MGSFPETYYNLIAVCPFFLDPHCTTLGEFGTHFLSSNTHLPVVVEDGVHVFYPHRINRSIKHDPLAVLNDRTGVFTECVSKYS